MVRHRYRTLKWDYGKIGRYPIKYNDLVTKDVVSRVFANRFLDYVKDKGFKTNTSLCCMRFVESLRGAPRGEKKVVRHQVGRPCRTLCFSPQACGSK